MKSHISFEYLYYYVYNYRKLVGWPSMYYYIVDCNPNQYDTIIKLSLLINGSNKHATVRI